MTVISYDVARERVGRGSALLDERSPGWWRTLVPESIDVRYCGRCVLGSMNPDVGFDGMLIELEIGEGDVDHEGSATWYGFDITDDEYADGGDEPYARVTDSWRNLIATRQVQAGLR